MGLGRLSWITVQVSAVAASCSPRVVRMLDCRRPSRRLSPSSLLNNMWVIPYLYHSISAQSRVGYIKRVYTRIQARAPLRLDPVTISQPDDRPPSMYTERLYASFHGLHVKTHVRRLGVVRFLQLCTALFSTGNGLRLYGILISNDNLVRFIFIILIL